jgi:hypothetical protein
MSPIQPRIFQGAIESTPQGFLVRAIARNNHHIKTFLVGHICFVTATQGLRFGVVKIPISTVDDLFCHRSNRDSCVRVSGDKLVRGEGRFTPYEVACYALYTVSSHVDVVGWDIHVQIVIPLGNIPVT